MKKINTKVFDLVENSIALEMGIEKGDIIISINDTEFYNILEYKYLINDDYIEVGIQKSDGDQWVLEIEKEYNEDIGIVFEEPLIDCERSCYNKCIFCFIDQLPPQMRETLYFKDDDYRLSFLQGNYVTLTNVTKDEIQRIVKFKISPINVSVHTTEPQLRKRMLNNNNADKIMENLKILIDGGIEVNAQIVLCPDVNDKEHLDKTINDLSVFYPMMRSVSIVPVGITKYRENLFDMKTFNEISSTMLINQVENWQNKLKEKYGTSFIFIGDEFYVLANKEIPSYEHYENFPQIENGVGLIAQFKSEFYEYFDKIKKKNIKINQSRSVSIVTGASAYKFIKTLCDELINKYNINIYLIKIRNDFFGETVTVTGLITGNDIMTQLEGQNLGDELIIPECMLRSGETVFLDDITVEEIENNLNIKVKINSVNGKEFIDNILGR